MAHDSVNHNSPAEAKISLFRSLFRGRDDVYPRRFESRKTGKSGYQPACANEWVRGLCEKPKIKCLDCPNRRFLAVTDDVVRWHLSGQDANGRIFVMGIYPMLLDETCFFLAADFDKAHWYEDAGAFLETCRSMSLPAALERSRSGNGGHIWLFFDQPIPAGLARRLGSHIRYSRLTLGSAALAAAVLVLLIFDPFLNRLLGAEGEDGGGAEGCGCGVL